MFELRPIQQESLAALAHESCHLICVAPTGSGKSLIYEKFAAKRGVRTLLVTPLVALGRQQAESLKKGGRRVSLGAGNPLAEDPTAIPGPRTGIWVVSPELLQSPSRARILEKWKPNFLVVDECHLLWEWGEDFRPSFAPLPELIQKYQIPRSLWLTATLPLEARKELRARLPRPVTEIGGFQVPSHLFINVLRVPLLHRLRVVQEFVQAQREQGLVFVATRNDTRHIEEALRPLGKKTVSYHAGLSREERRNIERQVSLGHPDVVIATSAFGMGVHFPQLQWVVLWQAPFSLLALSQSIGRVGRAGRPATAQLFWEEDDFRFLEWAVQKSPRRQKELLLTRQFLQGHYCRRQLLIRYFEALESSPCLQFCDHCSSKLQLRNEVQVL